MNRVRVGSAALVACFIVMVSSAQARGDPRITKLIPVTFTGKIVNDVTNEIQVAQPDGSKATFAGSVPDYPYKVGDNVTISFLAQVPQKGYFDPALGYRGQIASDGIYRITVSEFQSGTSDLSISGPEGRSTAFNLSVTGFGEALNFGQRTSYGAVLVYDANTDTYSLDNSTDRLLATRMSGPSYLNDFGSDVMVACGVIGGPGCNAPNGNTTFTASSDQVRGRVDVQSPTFFDAGSGFFNIIFGGSWNLPTYRSGATEVPEPGMMFLFGGAAAALMRSRRRKARQAA